MSDSTADREYVRDVLAKLEIVTAALDEAGQLEQLTGPRADLDRSRAAWRDEGLTDTQIGALLCYMLTSRMLYGLDALQEQNRTLALALVMEMTRLD
jgi:hypothetical protein